MLNNIDASGKFTIFALFCMTLIFWSFWYPTCLLLPAKPL